MDTFDSVFADLADAGYEVSGSYSGQTAGGRKFTVKPHDMPTGDLADDGEWLAAAESGCTVGGTVTTRKGNKAKIKPIELAGADAAEYVGRLMGLAGRRRELNREPSVNGAQ